MAGRILPRYLILVSTLTLVGIGIMLSIFYGQYRWLTSGIVASSVEQHDESLAASFERRARGQLHSIADALAESADKDEVAARRILERAIADNEMLVGLHYVIDGEFDIQTGTFARDPVEGSSLWDSEQLYMTYPVEQDDREIGLLTSSFTLAILNEESDAFEERLVALGTQSKQESFFWIGGATLFTLVLCGLVIWVISRMQAQRIRELKIQAEKLSDADYGEPLDIMGSDLLGDLAKVFNDMREKLKRTTISRDYVDSVLSSMNESIIVTSSKGIITRVNGATSRMLGYSNDELVGHHIDLIVDRKKGGALATNSLTDVPREAFLMSKSGDRIPVSYTNSSIDAEGDFHRAQNLRGAEYYGKKKGGTENQVPRTHRCADQSAKPDAVSAPAAKGNCAGQEEQPVDLSLLH